MILGINRNEETGFMAVRVEGSRLLLVLSSEAQLVKLQRET